MDQSLLSLLSMPDDALLLVLAYLAPRDLFRLRGLCRRLRDLCLHRDLWRCARVYTSSLRAALRLLRLAPCLRHLDLNATLWGLWPEQPELDEDLALEVSGSTCIVASLSLFEVHPRALACAATVVERFSALGGLRELQMELTIDEEEPSYWQQVNINPLVVALSKLGNLRTLEIYQGISETLFDDLEWPSTLIELTFSDGPLIDGTFLTWLLKVHAATLEQVNLDSYCVSLSALSKLPRLRSLTCYPYPENDLSEQPVWPNLEKLVLSEHKDEVTPRKAFSFLRGLRPVRSLSLIGSGIPGRSPAEPLAALSASPAAPFLEVLELKDYQDVRVLTDALPGFPSLQTLILDAFHDLLPAWDLLSSAPRLATLEISAEESNRISCPHKWMHKHAQNILDSNPHLHLRITRIKYGSDCPVKRWCDWCRLGCHPGLWDRLKWPTFAAHPSAWAAGARPADCCPADCVRWPC